CPGSCRRFPSRPSMSDCLITLTTCAPRASPFPYTTLFRSGVGEAEREDGDQHQRQLGDIREQRRQALAGEDGAEGGRQLAAGLGDRKSTRLNSSHVSSAYADFCLNKKTRPPLQVRRLENVG